MAVPQPVKFHITEAGPKKCVAQISCPVSPEAPHYENYWEAARAWETQLAGEHATFQPRKKRHLKDYEALLTPQEEDMKVAGGVAANYFYRNAGTIGREFGLTLQEYKFHMHTPSFAQLTSEDQEEFYSLKKASEEYRAASQVSNALDAEMKLNKLAEKYRSKEAMGAYKVYFDENILGHPEMQAIVERIANKRARQLSFERALERRLPIPNDAAVMFEEYWKADEHSFGSQLFFEKTIRENHMKIKDLKTSANPDAYANTLGFSNARRALALLQQKNKSLRSSYRMRGRNFAPTVNKVIRRLDKGETPAAAEKRKVEFV